MKKKLCDELKEKFMILLKGQRVNDDLSKQLFSFLTAVCNVHYSYLMTDNIMKGKKQEHLERVFAYELYYQWKKVGKYQNLSLHPEISKYFFSDSDDHIFPDMVLHGGQDSVEKQFIVCEIKRGSNIDKRNLRKDLNNLKACVSRNVFNNHPFEIGIYLV